MNEFFLSSWRAGFRGRSFVGVFLFALALVGIAYLSASFSPRQPQTVALDVGFSGLRFALSFFAVVLVQELVGREIERRTVILTLAYPASRTAYLFGRYVGIIALVGAATAILGLLLWLVVMVAGAGYEQQFSLYLGAPYWVTIAGIWLDVAVVAAFTLWISALSTVSMLPLLLGIFFLIASRALGAVFDYVAHNSNGKDPLLTQMQPLLEIVHWLLPDLSRLDWRVWPMYGAQPDMTGMVLAMIVAVSYAGMMLGLATHALMRREFS